MNGRYSEGSSFEQLKLAYSFDGGFRDATTDILMQAENVMKASLVHGSQGSRLPEGLSKCPAKGEAFTFGKHLA